MPEKNKFDKIRLSRNFSSSLRIEKGCSGRSRQYRPDSSCGVGEVLDLLRVQRASEDAAFPVGEPFLEDLVAAELVAPDGGGDVAPEGAGVQVHVERGLAEGGEGVAQGGAFVRREGAFDDAALAGHDRAARSVMAPSGGEREVVAGHVVPVRGGGYGDGGDLRA